MAYDWGTEWPGVFERHADWCPSAEGEPCTCGPLGYSASIPDPATGVRVVSPMLETPAEARVWRREQELAVDSGSAGARNGNGSANGTRHRNGDAPRVPRRAVERDPEPVAPPRREVRRRAPQPPPDPVMSMSMSELIDEFLDAAEDGEARGSEGRPYSDDELGELGWALTGYVESHLADVDLGEVRGRHVFRLIEELEDAGMPRSRLRSVIGALRQLFDYAADRGLVRVNPAKYISLPDDDRRPRRRLAETLETRRAPAPAPDRPFEGAMSEAAIWMIVKIVALVFVCIALVLAAESI
jgi:hypothetical protein